MFALFFVFLAITGIFLNHSARLGMDTRHVPGFIARTYLKNTDALMGVTIGDHWLYSLGGTLWIDGNEISDCYPGLSRVLQAENAVHVLCGDDLVMITSAGLLLEKVSGWRTDTKLAPDIILPDIEAWSHPVPVDKEIYERHIPPVSWNKFLLDLHSGVWFGEMGVLLTDLIAVAMILMAVTGLKMSRIFR